MQKQQHRQQCTLRQQHQRCWLPSAAAAEGAGCVSIWCWQELSSVGKQSAVHQHSTAQHSMWIAHMEQQRQHTWLGSSWLIGCPCNWSVGSSGSYQAVVDRQWRSCGQQCLFAAHKLPPGRNVTCGKKHCCFVLLMPSGYSLPLEGFLYRRPKGKLRLITDLSTSFDDVWVEQLETRVVLPEGAQGIKASVRCASGLRPWAGASTRFVRHDAQGSAVAGDGKHHCCDSKFLMYGQGMLMVDHQHCLVLGLTLSLLQIILTFHFGSCSS